MRFTSIVIITISIVHVNALVNNNASYDPNTIINQIFNFNNIEPRQRYGLIKFQDDNQINEPIGSTIKFEDNPEQVRQEDFRFPNYNVNEGSLNDQNRVHFEDVKDQKVKKKRRRKPKQYGLQRYPGYGFENGQGYQSNFNPGQAMGGLYRPPTPIPTDAVSTITRALTSIALNDDLQCVPKLLCESTGTGSSSSGILQNIAGLGPLLTLLSASSGATSSPLFVFGRAVLLGMTSKSSETCRLAYPQCPTEPDKLIYYLNNHNGGFFKFFNNPQLNQQNVNQFYNYENQNHGYGLYRPNSPPYGSDYGYSNYGYNGFQRRIQNKPNQERDTRFEFINEDYRNGNSFKFPDQQIKVENNNDFTRKARGFIFPDNRVDIYNSRYIDYIVSKPHDNRYVIHTEINKETDENVQILYVVRGNGDPNHPEIVRLKPGEKLNI